MRTAGELLALGAAGILPNLAYLAVGLWLLRALGPARAGSERLALGYVLGSGAASLAILGLRAADLPIPSIALVLVAASALPLLASRQGGAGATRTRDAAWVRAVDAAALAVAALTFAAALAPETAWDGFEYHLPMIAAWSEGPIRALPALLDAELRAGVDLLYVPAVAAGHPDAAAAVSACFALCLAALVRAEARRRASPGAGSLAGLFALAVPFTLDNAPTTYVDLAVGAYGFAALSSADRWSCTGERSALSVCVLALVFAANAKLHAAVLLPAAFAVASLGGRPPPLRAVLAGGAVFAGGVVPWLAKTAATTGNPFFPLLGGWFGTGPTSAELLSLRSFRLSTDFPAGRDPIGFILYIVSIFFGRNPHLVGLGPLPLALAPLAFHRLARSTAVLVAVLALLVVLQFVFMPALRFGAPLLPFVAVAAAVGGERLARSGAAGRATVAALLALLGLHHGAALAERYLPRLAALGAPEAYRRAQFPDQIALREMVSRAEPVVAIPKGAVAWMDRPVYNLLWERNGELYFHDLHWKGRLVRRRTPPDEALAILRGRGVRSLVLDVEPPLPADGTLGHPTVDPWIRAGLARRAPGPTPPARGGRVWVRVDLAPPP